MLIFMLWMEKDWINKTLSMPFSVLWEMQNSALIYRLSIEARGKRSSQGIDQWENRRKKNYKACKR